MSAIASYRALFRLTGPLYVLMAFLARLPLAMSQLGILLLLAHTTGSFAAGGATAGAFAVANALGAPLFGGLSDRLGQRRVVLLQSVAGGLGLLAVVACATWGLSWGLAWGWTAVVAAASGFVVPQVGPLARVRWRPIIGDGRRQLVDTAFSYEGAADEASFVLGPAFVGIVGTLADPAFAVVVAGIVLGIFGTWFAVHPTAGVVPPQTATAEAKPALFTPTLLTLGGAQLIIGAVFGSVQTGTTVIATAAGHAEVAGLFHALLGIGSVVAGVATAALSPRIPHVLRWRVAAIALALLSVPLLGVHSLAVLAPVLLVLGLSVAPYMITTFTLGEQTAPASRIGAAMTFLAAMTGLGYAVGAAIAGRLADWNGETPAFAVTVGAGVCAAVLAFARSSRMRATPGAVAERQPVGVG